MKQRVFTQLGSKADVTFSNLDVRFTPDFVAEVGDDRGVATGANFFK